MDGNNGTHALLSIAGSDFQIPFTRWETLWGASHNGGVVVHLSAMQGARKHDLFEWPGISAQQGPRGGVAHKLLLITVFY